MNTPSSCASPLSFILHLFFARSLCSQHPITFAIPALLLFHVHFSVNTPSSCTSPLSFILHLFFARSLCSQHPIVFATTALLS